MKPTGYFDWYSKSHEALLDGKYSTHMLDIVTDKEQRIGLISVAAVKQFLAGVELRRLELRVNGSLTELITHSLYFDMQATDCPYEVTQSQTLILLSCPQRSRGQVLLFRSFPTLAFLKDWTGDKFGLYFGIEIEIVSFFKGA